MQRAKLRDALRMQLHWLRFHRKWTDCGRVILSVLIDCLKQSMAEWDRNQQRLSAAYYSSVVSQLGPDTQESVVEARIGRKAA